MNLRYILTRTITVILVIVLALYTLAFVKKRQRINSIVSQLKSLSSEIPYFRQFSSEDAQKSLVRAVGLIAEAQNLGVDPDTTINRALGVEEKYFNSDAEEEDPNPRQDLIRTTLRANYENFRKLGYDSDFHTLEFLKKGDLPTVRTGDLQGTKAEVATIIDPALSPGLDTVLANLEIRPLRETTQPTTDVEIAIAGNLATDLEEAGIIEETALRRIQAKLAEFAESPVE